MRPSAILHLVVGALVVLPHSLAGPGRPRKTQKDIAEAVGKESAKNLKASSSRAVRNKNRRKRIAVDGSVEPRISNGGPRSIPEHLKHLTRPRRQYYRRFLYGNKRGSEYVPVPSNMQYVPLRVLELAYDLRLQKSELSLADSVGNALDLDRIRTRGMSWEQKINYPPPDSVKELLAGLDDHYNFTTESKALRKQVEAEVDRGGGSETPSEVLSRLQILPSMSGREKRRIYKLRSIHKRRSRWAEPDSSRPNLPATSKEQASTSMQGHSDLDLNRTPPHEDST